MNFNVNEIYKKDKKRNTNFAPSNAEDNVHKAYLDINVAENLSEVKSHKPFMETVTMNTTKDFKKHQNQTPIVWLK